MKGEKTGGRTKGTPNKATQEVRNLFEQLVRDNLPITTKLPQPVRGQD